MKKLRVDITLNDEEYKFIKGLSKRDGLTVHKELHQMLALQIWEEMELYKQEIEMDESNGNAPTFWEMELCKQEVEIEIK